jgi:hypothetical protein
MTDRDAMRIEAVLRLKRQADLTAYTARRFAQAARKGDLEAARRWRREYQLSAACCRALGSQARGGPASARLADRPQPASAGSERQRADGSAPEVA